eukprot:Gb_08160 [translate_table: standard]
MQLFTISSRSWLKTAAGIPPNLCAPIHESLNAKFLHLRRCAPSILLYGLGLQFPSRCDSFPNWHPHAFLSLLRIPRLAAQMALTSQPRAPTFQCHQVFHHVLMQQGRLLLCLYHATNRFSPRHEPADASAMRLHGSKHFKRLWLLFTLPETPGYFSSIFSCSRKYFSGGFTSGTWFPSRTA